MGKCFYPIKGKLFKLHFKKFSKLNKFDKSNMKKLVPVIITLALLLSSCKNLKSFKDLSFFKKNEKIAKNLENQSIETLYDVGYSHFEKKRYRAASEAFSAIYYKQPGTEMAAKAEIMEAYSLYNLLEFGEAIDILENFMLIHPNHQYIPYVKYLQAICYVRQMLLFTKDQENTLKAKAACIEFINNYPKTRYAEDLRLRLVMIEDVLEAHEMEIARYYISKNMPIAALKRLSNILERRSNTNHHLEALYRTIECYQMLGFKDEADKAYNKLSGSPESKWFLYANKLYNKGK